MMKIGDAMGVNRRLDAISFTSHVAGVIDVAATAINDPILLRLTYLHELAG